MLKILIGVVVLIGIFTGVAFFNFNKFNFNQATESVISSIPVTQAPPAISKDSTKSSSLIKPPVNIETSISKTGNVPAGSSLDEIYKLEDKIEGLETKLGVLQKRIELLESNTTSTTTTSQTSKPPLYIPLGSGGSFTDRTYTNFGGYTVNINPSNYAGYSSMQLEVSMRLNQPGEATKARFFNSTDNTAITNSEVSTTSTSFTLLTSGTFTLPSGDKTYQLQVLSKDGVETFVQNARIKVSF